MLIYMIALQFLQNMWDAVEDALVTFNTLQVDLQQNIYPDTKDTNLPLKQLLNGILFGSAIGFGMLGAYFPPAAGPRAFLSGLIGLIASIISTSKVSVDESLQNLADIEEYVQHRALLNTLSGI